MMCGADQLTVGKAERLRPSSHESQQKASNYKSRFLFNFEGCSPRVPRFLPLPVFVCFPACFVYHLRFIS